MRHLSIAGAALFFGAAAAWAQQAPAKPTPWKPFNKGVKWEKSLDDAKARAAKEGKPILLYQLVGDLDKEGC